MSDKASEERQRRHLEHLAKVFPGVHGPQCKACVRAIQKMDEAGLLSDELFSELPMDAPAPGESKERE